MSKIKIINDAEQSALVSNSRAKNGEMYLKADGSTNEGDVVVYYNGSWIRFDNEYSAVAAFQNRWGASFDGASAGDYLAVSAASDLSISGDCSISAWFNPSSVSGYSYIFSLSDGRSGGTDRAFGLSGTQLVSNTYGFGYNLPFTHTAIATGNWYHAVVVFTSGTARMYLNGSDLGTKSVGTNALSYTQTVIGGMLYNNNYRFEGLIEDVAVFDAALSAADITKIYNGTAPNGKPTDLALAVSYDTDRTSNLKGYWRMGDDSNDSATSGGSIATITDSSGNGNDATQSTASSQPTFCDLSYSESIFVSNQNHWGVDFNGGKLSVASTSDFDFGTSGFTISMWFIHDNAGQALFDFRGPAATPMVWINSSSIKYYVNGGYQITGSYTHQADTWRHLVLHNDGSGTTSLYLDDLTTPLGTYSDSTNYAQAPLTIGTYGVNGGGGNNKIDEFSVFNSTSSLSSLTDLVSGGKPTDLNSYNPVAWYRMGDDSNDSPVGNGSVTGITDSSGNGNDATQSTASMQPTFYDLAPNRAIYV